MKKMRAIIASFLAVATLFSFTGCSSFKVIDDEDVFFDALEDAVGIDKDETTHAKNTKINGDKVEYLISAKDGDNHYYYVRFKKEDDAMDYFDDLYEDFDDLFAEKEFDGSHAMSLTKTRGAVTFNGEFEYSKNIGKKYVSSGTELYGGIYVNKNVYIEVYSANGSKRDKEKIDTFIKTLGFPKP